MSDKYSNEYSESGFFEKIKKFAKKAGLNVIYAALILYYTLQKPDLPAGIKATIVGALGYFIFPLDAIADITPVVGYADDLGVLVAALVAASLHIDQGVKKRAREKLESIFGYVNDDDIKDIDDKIE
jgi:uncharacterized membrane protein YkvA (DUF1232 family)